MKRLSCMVLLLLAASMRPAGAAVTDYLDRLVVEVHLQTGGADVRDPSLLDIVVTRTGEPLTMAKVRETLAHLYGLGRYRDVQVDATLKDGAVVLTYTLVPVQRVRRIVFEGPLKLKESELRRAVVDRYGASPSLARAPEAVSTLQTIYRDHGYSRAQVTARADAEGTSAALVFAIQPGVQARVGVIDVQGTPNEPVPALLSKIGLKRADPYDGVALDRRLAKYADGLRGQGYYQARMAQLPRYASDAQTVDLVLSVDPGPHVEIVFQGDPLSARERDELVPIAREHSIDEDILEDSKFAIEGRLRSRGYCTPRADYLRSATAGVLRIAFTVTRGPLCTLERADTTGNVSIPSDELAPMILLQGGQPFVESTLGSDVARIQGLYRRRGFAGVKVVPQVDRGEERAGAATVRVRLVITEGARSLIRTVVFDGNGALPAETLRPSVTSQPGQPYFEPQIASDADALSQLYLNRGYQEVSVQPDPRRAADPSSVDLHFIIHEGPQVLVDHVLIVGNARTKTDTIAREVQLKSGQPLSQQDEDETRSRLTALGIFRRVDISYLQLPGALTHRDVVVTVDEAPLTTVGYGGGLEGGKKLVSENGGPPSETFQLAPRGFFEVGRRNIFGKDRSLNLVSRVSFTPRNIPGGDTSTTAMDTGGYGFNEYLLRLTYGERRMFGTPADATFSGGIEQTERTSFNFNRRSATATLARRVKRILAISGRYSIDHTRLFDYQVTNPADKPLIDRLFPQVRLSTVSGSLIRDTRNDAIDPGAGGLIGLDAELAARGIGSEVGFFKTFLQGFAYRKIDARGTVAAFGSRVGLATGFPRTIVTVVDGQTITQVVDDLPASERFFAGGDTTVRGFALDRLGRPDTVDPSGFPKGGHGLVVLNAELRVPVRGGLGVVGFLDAGNVFLHVNDMNLGQLRGAVGFGIRYKSPIGPVRVDLGIKLDRRIMTNGGRERPTALHISLGQAF
jgi:outer membrane protein insertion porin family